MLRFIVWPGETYTYVWDYYNGLVETEFTNADFEIAQCKAQTYESVLSKPVQE